MRALNIAREIRAIEPAGTCVFVSRGSAARDLVGEEFEVVTAADDDPRPPAVAAAESLDPHVVVYDTALPDRTGVVGAAAVYVMRRSLPERQQEVMDSPVLRDMARIIVPHTAEDFGYGVPADIAERCRFVGPIGRRPTTAGAARARERYDARGALLITSTVGGGGFQEQAEAFLATAARLQGKLAARRDLVRHVIVRGPNFTGRAAPVPGACNVTFDPDLVDLLAASDLVVAEGGYNTVMEVRLAQVPAAFLPSVRAWDDQEARVRALEHAGLARVLTTTNPGESADVIAALADDPAWLAGVRDRYVASPLDTGNKRAAGVILELIE